MSGETAAAPPPGGWRLRIGFALVILSLITPVLIPLVTATDLPVEVKTAISGLLVFGIPQALMVVAIVIVGKSGFAYIKDRVFGSVKDAGGWVLGSVRRLALPQRVSRTRHRIGLAMFALSILFGWLSPYLGGLVPGLVTQAVGFGIAGDLLLLVSLFVLGGDFWDKLHALFVQDVAPEAGGAMPEGGA